MFVFLAVCSFSFNREQGKKKKDTEGATPVDDDDGDDSSPKKTAESN